MDAFTQLFWKVIIPFIFSHFYTESSLWNAYSVCTDQTSYSVASELGLHCLPVSLLGYSRHKWAKSTCASTQSYTGPASVAQLDAPSDWRPGGRGFNPRRGRQHSVVEIDHEIFSTVILSLPLIQEGQLSVSGERMCTILVNRLEN